MYPKSLSHHPFIQPIWSLNLDYHYYPHANVAKSLKYKNSLMPKPSYQITKIQFVIKILNWHAFNQRKIAYFDDDRY